MLFRSISLNSAYGDTLNPYGTKAANTVLAGPTTGAPAAPTFRALVPADIPTLNQSTTGSAGSLLNALTIGTGLGGGSYNGSSAVTITNTDKGSDQNIFKNVALSGAATNSITCVADNNNDTLTLAAASGSGIGISADASTDTITFSNTGVTGITANLVPSGGSFGGIGTINFTGTANQVHLNSSGSTLTFSAPQNIHTSATPTFAGVTLTGLSGYLKAGVGGAVAASSTIPSSDISNTSFVDLTNAQSIGGIKTFNSKIHIGATSQSTTGIDYTLAWSSISGAFPVRGMHFRPTYQVSNVSNSTVDTIAITPVIDSSFWGDTASSIVYSAIKISPVTRVGSSSVTSTTALNIENCTLGSTNYAIYSTHTGASVLSGSLTATSIIKSGGTSSQFLKADGSVDSNTYLTSAVTSLTGTSNQVTVSASTGSVTLSLPQSIHTGASVQFNSLGIGTAAGAAGEIRATDNITAYYTSDERLKTNVRPIENALDKVSQLDGVIYDWNDTYKKDHGDVDGYFVRADNSGVIAQQVEKVFPNVVADRADGFKAVRYELDRKSTRLNSSHVSESRMPSSA